MNYKLTLEYIGSGFFGFQKQKGLRTIAGVLEESLSKVFEEPIKVVYASRTDRGVNATGQVASFFGQKKFDTKLLMGRLNRLLPDDLKIVSLEYASDDFMASRHIKSKTYLYKIFNDRANYPVQSQGCAFCKDKLNIRAMKKGAKFLVGEHDFTSFCSAECEKEIKVRKLFCLKIFKKGKIVFIVAKGNGFLQHMVRIIVGTLIKVGQEKLAPKDVKTILEAKDRRHKGQTESPNGLYLTKVEYFK